MTDGEMIDRLIRLREGRAFTHTASDRGGATKFGITKRTLSEWRGRDVTVREVMDLTEGEARDIYQAMYLAPFAPIEDARLRELLFDVAVLQGIGRAKRWLQEALDVEADGILGPHTIAAYHRANLVEVYRAVLARRILAFGETVAADPLGQVGFLRGWLQRAVTFL